MTYNHDKTKTINDWHVISMGSSLHGIQTHYATSTNMLNKIII